MAACETTAGSPEIYDIQGVRGGVAMPFSACTLILHGRCATGSVLEIQVTSLFVQGRYEGVLMRGGACEARHPNIVNRTLLTRETESSEGVDGRIYLTETPIHELVKSDYLAGVYDKHTKRVIGCVPLHSERAI